jgi:hypothetical protein
MPRSLESLGKIQHAGARLPYLVLEEATMRLDWLVLAKHGKALWIALALPCDHTNAISAVVPRPPCKFMAMISTPFFVFKARPSRLHENRLP